MTGRTLTRLSPIAIVLVAAACGGGGGGSGAGTTSPPAPPTRLTVYFLLNGNVQPVARVVPHTAAVASKAFLALQLGPRPDEKAAGLTSDVPRLGSQMTSTPTTLSLTTDRPLSPAALAQTVFTLTQFPGRSQVEVDGKTYSRSDFEGVTPAILVESPLPFQAVSSPLEATGTANTFEATFQYELTDENGNVIAKNFVTATSGSGVRGTFDVTIPFGVPNQGPGKLTVFEVSAKDGSRIHQVSIPLTLEP